MSCLRTWATSDWCCLRCPSSLPSKSATAHIQSRTRPLLTCLHPQEPSRPSASDQDLMNAHQLNAAHKWKAFHNVHALHNVHQALILWVCAIPIVDGSSCPSSNPSSSGAMKPGVPLCTGPYKGSDCKALAGRAAAVHAIDPHARDHAECSGMNLRPSPTDQALHV